MITKFRGQAEPSRHPELVEGSGRVEARSTHSHSSTRTLTRKSMLCPALSDTNK